MTKEELEKLVKLTKINTDKNSFKAVSLVLVDGYTQTNANKKTGVSQGSISRMIKRIREVQQQEICQYCGNGLSRS